MLVESELGGVRVLRVFGDGITPRRFTLPEGPLAVTRWGEVVAVATPSAIELLDTRDGEASSIAVLDGPRALIFSASGHQIYVTTDRGLIWFDRFTGDRIDSLPLAPPPAQMRMGELGRFLFLRDSGVDSVTVFDVHRGRVVGRLQCTWNATTPAVAHDGTLVIRKGDVVATIDPETLEEIASVRGSRGDVWTVAAWDPMRPVTQQDNATVAAQPQEEAGNLYVQVSSSQNRAWAEDFRRRLGQAGLSATVMDPEDEEGLYRVVLGPYNTRQEAETVGRSLGRPYWIFKPDASTANQ
jgi:hypothetical protein